MKRKLLNSPQQWRPVYSKIQYMVRRTLVEQLVTNRGIVLDTDVSLAFSAFLDKSAVIKNCFVQLDDNHYEWIKKINSFQKLAHQLGVTESEIPQSVKDLFIESRKLQNRRTFPHLVYTDRKHYIRTESFGNVFGYSILVRPIVEFTKVGCLHNDFIVGERSIGVFIHVDLDNNLNMIGDQLKIRVVTRRAANIYCNFDDLGSCIKSIKLAVLDSFRKKDYAEVIYVLTQTINDYIANNSL